MLRILLLILVGCSLANCTRAPLQLVASTQPIEPERARAADARATGFSCGMSLFGLFPLEEASLARAVDNAKASAKADTLVEVSIEVSSRWLLLVTETCVHVSGRGTRAPRYTFEPPEADEAPEPAEPAESAPTAPEAPTPPAPSPPVEPTVHPVTDCEALCTRFENFAQSPSAKRVEGMRCRKACVLPHAEAYRDCISRVNDWTEMADCQP